MHDTTPSLTKQGLDVRFIAKDPGVLAYNSGLARHDEGWFALASRVFDPTTRKWDIVLYRLHTEEPVPRAERLGSMKLPRPGDCELEDCRLIEHAGRWYAAYTEGYYTGPAFVSRQALARLKPDLTFEKKIALPYGGNLRPVTEPDTSEKNWQFFSHEGRLLFIPSISPHVVLEVDVKRGVVNAEVFHYSNPVIHWMHGALRGGTPPVRVGDEYVSFFHSHTLHPQRHRRYSMSAYTFAAGGDFAITRITRPLLKGSAEDLSLPNPKVAYWNPLVVFPVGAHYCAEAKHWLVSAGVNDSYDALIVIPHRTLAFEPIARWADPCMRAAYLRTVNASLPVKVSGRNFVPWTRLRDGTGVLRTDVPDVLANAEAMLGVTTITERDYETSIRSQ